jgi:hypothetical protein
MLKTPSGAPPRTKSPKKAAELTAEYSAGFQTTAFPASSAGTMYQDGTATEVAGGDHRRHPDRLAEGEQLLVRHLAWHGLAVEPPALTEEASQVSMTSRTSPSASAYGLPISAVTSLASASALSSTSRPMCAMARPRTGAGTAAQASWAFRAASAAPTKTGASANETSPTTSDSSAGLVLGWVCTPATGLPPTTDVTIRVLGVDTG